MRLWSLQKTAWNHKRVLEIFNLQKKVIKEQICQLRLQQINQRRVFLIFTVTFCCARRLQVDPFNWKTVALLPARGTLEEAHFWKYNTICCETKINK